MSNVEAWNISASSNGVASPNGWPENMSSAGLNDSGREMMAAIKRFYLDNEWLDVSYGASIVRDSGTQITINGVDTHLYFNQNRRIKIVGSGGTKYGFVESGTYTGGNTVVVVTIDTPDSIPTGPSAALLHHSASLNRIAFGGTIPTACIMPWGGSSITIPTGYLLCNGAELSQATYAGLWTAFGGHLYGNPANPSVDFKLPTLGGQIITGWKSGGDGDGDYGTVGVAYGTKKPTISTAQAPVIASFGGASSTETPAYSGVQSGTGINVATYNHTHTLAHAHSYSGTGTAFDVRQPSITMAYIIKT